jgi:hypothetical protein
MDTNEDDASGHNLTQLNTTGHNLIQLDAISHKSTYPDMHNFCACFIKEAK